MRTSAATFMPTCFMKTRDLRPPIAAEAPTSMATFSFTAYWNWRPASLATSSRTRPISEEGVPGYVAARSTPASMAARAIASLPRRRRVSPALADTSRSFSAYTVIPPRRASSGRSHGRFAAPVGTRASVTPLESIDLPAPAQFGTWVLITLTTPKWQVMHGRVSRRPRETRRDGNRDSKVDRSNPQDSYRGFKHPQPR